MRELREHQHRAVQAIVAGLAEHDRGLVTMACGAGKTLTAKRDYNALTPALTLVLLPSLALVKQTVDDWRSEDDTFALLAVCSDQSVVAKDHLVQQADELGVPTTTDPEQVGRFLRGRGSPRVVFATYQSAAVIAAAQEAGGPAFDLMLCDEAHRTTGRIDGQFALPLTDAIKADRRLFLTATPKVVRGADAASMDDERLYGPRLFDYPFRACAAGLRADVPGLHQRTARTVAPAQALLGGARR